jgi:hypothetical protein
MIVELSSDGNILATEYQKVSMVRRMESNLVPILSAVPLMFADITELTDGCQNLEIEKYQKRLK